MTYHNPWIFENNPVEVVPDGSLGFIYLITNLIDGRKYIGKKKSTNIKTTYKVTTRKNGDKYKKKIKTLVDSDWKTYYGSSKELQLDVNLLGSENFKREITRWCLSLSELTYYEGRAQFVSDCLLLPSEFYNAWVSCRSRRDHLLKTHIIGDTMIHK